jgi:MFS family permease
VAELDYEAPGRARVLYAFRSRDFRLLWTGQTVSLIGDSAFFVALGWKVFSVSGSGALGVVLMLQAVGMVATLLVGGALADRYSRRTLMIVSDLARFALVAVLVAVDVTGEPSLALLGALALGNGLASGFFMPAFGGIVPLVVEQPQLASANALIGISRQASLIVGPAAAGVVYGLTGSEVVFAFDAASFLVSAGLIWRARPRAFEAQAPEGALREIATGLRYVASSTWLWLTIALFSVFLMVVLAPIQVLMPKLVEEHFHRGVGAYGLLLTFQGVGMVAGTLLFGQLDPRRRRGLLSYGLWIANALLIAAMVLSPEYWLAAVFAVLRGGCLGFGIAVWDTMLMELVPTHLLSRVISVDYFGSLGLMPVGLVVAGAASGLASPQLLMAGGALFSAALFAAGLLHRGIRTVQ